MTWTQKLKQRLHQHYTAPMEVTFRQFRLGLSFFFCGLVIIYGASQLLEPSIQQELVVLVGLLVGGCGFVVAILAQARMIISRIWRFFNESKSDLN